jgi:glycosyltransferase involved in cell wall biosynthesis
MPILHYPPVIGGFEIFSQNISERISKTDDVWVITSKVDNTPNQEQKDKLRIFRTSPWTLKNLSYSKPWFIFGAMIWILFKSAKIIKKEKINLIHAQGFLSGIIALILKKITKTPYLLTIQSADFSVYHPRMNINIIKIIYKKIEKTVFKNADYCHAVSNYLADHVGQYGVKKIVMIPNGVNWEKFNPDPNKKQTRKDLRFETENLIVCVSRLEHKNGTHDLIESAKYLQDIDFKMIICGSGSEKEKLQKMAEGLGLKDKILFLGDILHSELPKYVACADIFVRPSLAEGFGIVFLEAMACNVAVIGTPVGGIPDFLRNNETGLLCNPGDPKDIAEKIEILIQNKESTQRLIKNGFKMVREEYGWDKIADRIKKLYEKVLSDNIFI